MATSGTYAFNLEVAELVDEAFERAGVDPEILTARHLRSARRSLNLIFSDWANEGIKLWQVDTYPITVVQGTATYNLPAEVIATLDVYVRNSDGIDTMIEPMARDEYSGAPDKAQEGFVSRYYLNRQVSVPLITFWQVPDNSTDVVYVNYFRQFQDVGAASNTLDVPYRWLEATTAHLAARMAAKFNPEREGNLTIKANEAFDKAKTEDRQRTPTSMRVSYGRRGR